MPTEIIYIDEKDSIDMRLPKLNKGKQGKYVLGPLDLFTWAADVHRRQQYILD